MNAVGRAYERLAYTADYEKIDLIEYLRQIVGDLEDRQWLRYPPSGLQRPAPFSLRQIARSLSG